MFSYLITTVEVYFFMSFKFLYELVDTCNLITTFVDCYCVFVISHRRNSRLIDTPSELVAWWIDESSLANWFRCYSVLFGASSQPEN